MVGKTLSITERTEAKLHSIASYPNPTIDENKKTVENNYPEYFKCIQNYINELNIYIHRIEDVIERVEL